MFILETFVHRYRGPCDGLVYLQFLRPLMECATERDVQFLDAKTTAKMGTPVFTAFRKSGKVVASRSEQCSVPSILGVPP